MRLTLMTTWFLMLVNRTYEEKSKEKREEEGGRPSGRNKQEESKLAHGGKDMAIRYMNRAKEEKSKADGNTDTFNKLTSTINTNTSAILPLMFSLNLHDS